MKKGMFKLMQRLVGAKMDCSYDQRAFDFVFVGARKACIVDSADSFRASQWFYKKFDVYSAYPEGAEHLEDKEELYQAGIPTIIVKKGTDMSHVFYEVEGDLHFRHEQMGIMLGFPPEECANFQVIQDRVGVDYYGLVFACERNRLDSAIAYLEKTFSLPQWMKNESAFSIH